MQRSLILSLPVILITSLMSCNLEKDISIDLPDYTSQPVVECYLEPGKPYRLLLTRSSPYFSNLDIDDPTALLWNGATIRILADGQEVLLENQILLDPVNFRIANYGSEELVPEGPGHEFVLNIQFPDGTSITGEATQLAVVPMDSLVIETNAEGKSRVITYFREDLTRRDYYRRIVQFGSADSTLQDFLVDDDFFDTEKAAFGTGYGFAPGDTIIHILVHMDEGYYRYLNSVNQSISANLNPFGQPGLIESTVEGSAHPLGVFTGLVMDRDTVIIP